MKLDFNSKVFLLLLMAVSICFIMIILPFLSAIFWACILAIAFSPVHRLILAKIPNYPNLAAICSVAACTVVLVVPFIFMATFIVQELIGWYTAFNVKQYNLLGIVTALLDRTPKFGITILNHFELYNAQDIVNLLNQSLSYIVSFITAKAISLSQNAAALSVELVIIIYLMFFLLRDGIMLKNKIQQVIPIEQTYIERLVDNFTTVVIATVKGTLVIAILQGVVGGIMLYCFGVSNVFLWTVVMAVLSLLPIVGASLVWGPVAIYFIATGKVIEGVAIIIIGTFLIGIMDNVLRPLLVGKDTKLPDYLVLLSTIGGLYLFGFLGFVLGPVVAALFVAIWNLFGELQNHDESKQIIVNRNKHN